jgi:hypothetical protein
VEIESELDYEIDKKKFKTAKGAYITQGLIHEFCQNPKLKFYTIQGHDIMWHGKRLYSLKKAYMTMEDPTEYLFAEKYFCDWNHWQRVCENKAIRRHIEEWRKELQLKLKAKGIAKMRDLASTGDREASKWMAECKWDAALRGRPKKLTDDEIDNPRDTSDTARILALVKETKNG